MPDDLVAGEGTGAQNVLVDPNWQTSAAIGLTLGTAGVGGILLLTALPAQTLAVGTAAGALAYAGKWRKDHDNADISTHPLLNRKDKDAADKTVNITPAPAAA